MHLRIFLTLGLLVGLMGVSAPAARAVVPYAVGDVFAGVGNGNIRHLSPAGASLELLNTGAPLCSEQLGMAFTTAGHLLATSSFGTCFGAGRVVEFDNAGNLVGNFGGGYSSSTESITINAAGDVFVGQPDGTRRVRRFTSAGVFVTEYSPVTGPRGTDWIDLAADQCTLFYTSEGNAVRRFDVCANDQELDFAILPTAPLFALRIRQNGEVMVAGSNAGVYRLSPAGVLLQTYPRPVGETSFLFALNLDPDGVSFWTGGYQSGNVYRINIATGAVITSFNASRVGCCLSGLAVFGEFRAAQVTPGPKTNPARVTGAGSVGSVLGPLDFTVDITRATVGGPITGSLTKTTRNVQKGIRSTAITELTILEPNKVFVEGTCVVVPTGEPCTFRAIITDGGRAGGRGDFFEISTNNGPFLGGPLTSGDVIVAT